MGGSNSPSHPPRSTRSTKSKGDHSEQVAVEHLQQQGYTIIARNYRCRLGEIDIIAEEDGVLCFVEVRSVATRTFGDPLQTIDGAKQRRILKTAQHYLAARQVRHRQIRFDVVGIVQQPQLLIQLVRRAFEDRSAW